MSSCAMQLRRDVSVWLGISFLVCCWAGNSSCQISKPVAHDDNMKDVVQQNKYLWRDASDDMLPVPKLDEEALANTQCPQHLELRWQTEVSSSVYANPLIADINSDGKLEVLVPSFVHYLEALEGADGEKVPGFPAFHQSTVHASPLLYDIDKDGIREILLATFNGEVLFFRNTGFLIPDKLTVPRLRVRKDWFKGLDQDWADRNHPDVDDEGLKIPSENLEHLSQDGNTSANVSTSVDKPVVISNSSLGTAEFVQQAKGEVIQNVSNTGDASGEQAGQTRTVSDGLQSETQAGVVQNARRLLEEPENQEAISTVENDQQILDEDAFELFRDEDNLEEGITDEYNYDYDDYVDENMWGDEDWTELAHEKEEDYTNVDAHILCTPVIADIDNDGIDEMVVASSFFYDREYYEAQEHKQELGDLDIGKYVGCSIVVFNLETKQVKWNKHLDLSTDSVSFRAYTYSSPTVVDFDGDGFLEIVVGTSFGLVYVLRHNGEVMEKFPMQMGEIQGQVIAADINDDGLLEIVAADTRGNVAAWNSKGEELWERHLKSLIAQGPTVGDVDGDGHTDIVIPTASGNIYVLKGSDGSTVGGYPFRTHGRVMAPALLVDLSKKGGRKGLTIAVTSFDGYFYLVDGPTGCADAIDIGETSYTMVVADNVDGGDDLDLIVTTMNGNVLCFQTPSLYHPLKAWPAQAQGRNVVASRSNRQGIHVLGSSRKFRDEAGDSFWVPFEIVDRHRLSGHQGPYNVKVTMLVPGHYQGQRKIVKEARYDQPGTQKIQLPVLPLRTGATVLLEMTDKNGLYFTDEFSLTFHMRYYRLLKWLLVLPLMGMAAVIILIRPQDAIEALPSFTSDIHSL